MNYTDIILTLLLKGDVWAADIFCKDNKISRLQLLEILSNYIKTANKQQKYSIPPSE